MCYVMRKKCEQEVMLHDTCVDEEKGDFILQRIRCAYLI